MYRMFWPGVVLHRVRKNPCGLCTEVLPLSANRPSPLKARRGGSLSWGVHGGNGDHFRHIAIR